MRINYRSDIMNNQTHIVIDNVITGNTALVIVGLSILGAATIIGAGIYGATRFITK